MHKKKKKKRAIDAGRESATNAYGGYLLTVDTLFPIAERLANIVQTFPFVPPK